MYIAENQCRTLLLKLMNELRDYSTITCVTSLKWRAYLSHRCNESYIPDVLKDEILAAVIHPASLQQKLQ